MSNLRVSISIIGVIIGIIIFLVSLMAAADISLVKGLAMSQRKLYLNSEILPDNILYPLVSGRDRMRLSMADPEERVVLQAIYSERRYQAAADLLSKGENELALITLRKSLIYLSNAVNGAGNLPNSAEIESHLKALTEQRLNNLELISQDFSDVQKQTLESIISETEALAGNF